MQLYTDKSNQLNMDEVMQKIYIFRIYKELENIITVFANFCREK